MRRIIGIFMILAMLLVLVPTGAALAAVTKVNVCHYDKDAGLYFLINISENAFPAHVDHGDASPGEPVPGMPGMKFTDICEVIPILPDLNGHWIGRSGVVGNLIYEFYMDLVMGSDGTVTGEIQYTKNSTAHRTVTGSYDGTTLKITTADASYWAYVEGTATAIYFYGTGTDISSRPVALEAWRP